MDRKECAAALQDKTFHEIQELPELFLTEMQQSGLYFCFCPDRMYFYIMGAHNEVIAIGENAAENKNITIQVDADGGVHFRAADVHATTPGTRLIRLQWQSLDHSGGYVLQSAIEGIQVHLSGEGHHCIGLLFSRAALLA
ncbi:hypothetical protein [Taibaiella koreensis]|uniref:hypothetical protein n=1 Tax=Taibaiella koreensis TaxID=1268548 RepID=UPI000E59A5C8|nr:hypothetical protein [Taibaiella koreensis]